jgi:hypothetical protein
MENEGKEIVESNGLDVEIMPEGAFQDSLMRNNKQIRRDRAIVIVESAYINYKRLVEDLDIEIKQVKRDRENMLDLSPQTAQSLVVASDFDATAFVKKDIELGIKIRNLEIKRDVAKERFEYLFGRV